ncbi:CGNR zinc finger domain-containing protein [Gordonia hydrophobica]|uniref:CGNR zinc finger domain-containing protein n=1 Tax=Gordonia hydrophobica TaxID=40516 RepID=A0ABZ2TZU9_9ACTN|nr:CGNR zinc finger domain-containing protein [Gordonia hydrophobica]MBM7366377.1 putative RNA-binding Zn ribbon-like protein [Gordonia hydrophobica]
MQFNHDNMTGPLLAAELASLAADAWTIGGAERTLEWHRIRRAELSQESSERLRQWAVQLRSVFSAGNEELRYREINRLLEAGTTRAYLTTHDGLKPHLHFTSDDDDVVARVKAVTAGGLALFTVEAEGGRLGACTRAGCPQVFVDTSRNGRRAFCSAKCGNYVAVRRHRGLT